MKKRKWILVTLIAVFMFFIFMPNIADTVWHDLKDGQIYMQNLWITLLEGTTDNYGLTDGKIRMQNLLIEFLNSTDEWVTLIADSTYSDTLSADSLEVRVAVIDSIMSDKYMLDSTPANDSDGSGIRTVLDYGESVAVLQTLYMGVDGELLLSDADTIASMPIIAIAMEAGGDGESNEVILQGVVRYDTWNWTTGDGSNPPLIYASTTAGGLTQTAPAGNNDVVQIVGIALSPTSIYFDPEKTTIVLTVP